MEPQHSNNSTANAPAAAVNGALLELALAGRAELQPGGLAAAIGR